MNASQRRSWRRYSATAEGAVRYVPVTRGGEVVGYLWAEIDGEAASFRATVGDNMDGLGVSAAWDRRLRESYAEGLTPLAALRQWIGAPEDPRGGGISPDVEEKEAASETAMVREVIDPNYVDRSDQWEGLLFQGDDRAREQYIDLKSGLPVGVPATSYPFFTDAAIRFLPVYRNGVPCGYLWASVRDEAAGYLPRAEVADAATDTYRAWTARLDEAKAEGLSPLRALHRWAGAPEDPVAGVIPAEAVVRELPGLEALEEIADRAG